MEFILLAVPPVVTAIMFGVKYLAGLAMFANGARNHPFLRFALVLISLLGIVGTPLLTGNEIDPDSISSLVWTVIQTAVGAFGSHLLYKAVRNVSGE